MVRSLTRILNICFSILILGGSWQILLAQTTSSNKINLPNVPRISNGALMSHSRFSLDLTVLKKPRSVNRLLNPSRGILTAFEGFNYDDDATENNGFVFIPPDPMGAAGRGRLVAVANTMIESRDKAGTLLWRDGLQDFFSPLDTLTLGTFTFDPKVIYDHFENRFLVVALEQTDTLFDDKANASRILLAVSKTGAPSGAGADDWHYLAIDSKVLIDTTEYWADYPGMEVDDKAVYLTNNIFSHFGSGANYGGVRLWIIDKGIPGGFYSGGPASFTIHDPYKDAGIPSTTMPAQVYGSSGVRDGVGTFLVSYSGIHENGDELVQVVRVDNPLGNVTFTQEFVNVGDVDNINLPLPGAPQKDSNELVEVNDRRALDAVWRDDFLWLTTTILPNSGENEGETTAHWFKLNTANIPGNPIFLEDQGDIGGEDIAPNTTTFFPSVAVNSAGDAKFGFSASAATIYPGAYVCGRRSNDLAGTVQESAAIHAGKDFYFRTFGGGSNRWGDYSGISLDPVNDNVFWVFNEYAEERAPEGDEDGRWGTAWASCTFDPGVAPTPAKLLISEIVVTPAAREFIEIFNPNPFSVTLANYYLTYATPAATNIYYYQTVEGNGGGGEFGDFNARFPEGAAIDPGEYQTISLIGDSLFFDAYGVLPTYELFEDSSKFADNVPQMREATPGSINNQGGLTNSEGVVILYNWDGASDLVQDVDYLLYNSDSPVANSGAVDKTGVKIDGPDAGADSSMYLPDTPISSQVSAATHDNGFSLHRKDFAEGAQKMSGGNGVTGGDETSEDLDNTFTNLSLPSPNKAYISPPSASFFANLNGGQEVPLVPTSAYGTGTFTLNHDSTELSYEIEVSGLKGEISAAYFYNAPADSSGPFVRTLHFANGTVSGIWKTSDLEPLTPALVAQLFTGNIYINVNTDLYPTGEVRGQLVQDGVRNNPPSAAQLLAPISGKRYVTSASSTDSVEYSWRQANDPENDSLVYLMQGDINASFDSGLLYPQALTDTSLHISLAGLDTLLNNFGIIPGDSTKFYWRIFAMDSVKNLTASVDTFYLKLVRKSLPNPPLKLAAESGMDGVVPLRWLAPGAYFIGFELGIPSFWQVWNLGDNTSGETWTATTSDAYDGNQSAMVPYGPQGEFQDEWLISAPVVIGGRNQLHFFHRANFPEYDSAPNYFEISTTGDPGSFTVIDSFSYSNGTLPDNWTEVVVDLSAYQGQKLYLAWNYQSTWGEDWLLDAISLNDVQGNAEPVRIAGTVSPKARRTKPSAHAAMNNFPVKQRKQDGPAAVEREIGTVLGYNIYRSTTPQFQADPTHLLAKINGDTTKYNDLSVTNFNRYFYVVTAVYDTAESPASNVAAGAPYVRTTSVSSAFTGTLPTLDGVIDPDEWSAAEKVYATRAGLEGEIRIMNTDDFLFLAVRSLTDSTLDDFDQVGIYFDTDNNGMWAPDSSEGNYWVYLETGRVVTEFRPWFPDTTSGDIVTASGVSGAIGNSSGWVEYEIRIDRRSAKFSPLADNTTRIYLFVKDGGSSSEGDWPENAVFNSPSTFGDLILPPYVGIERNVAIPVTFSLSPNFPNPFNPTTTIKYQLPQSVEVNLTVFDILGRRVRQLVENRVDPGYYEITWDGKDDLGANVASGLYVLQIHAGGFVKSYKMMLMK